MESRRSELVWSVGGLIVSASLALILVASIFMGLLLAALFTAAVIVVGPMVAIAMVVTGLRTRAREPIVTVARPVVAPAPVPVPVPASTPVVARVLTMSGSCAGKVQYHVGDRFTFAEGKKTAPVMCGPAVNGLLPYVQKLRLGQGDRAARIVCPLSGNVLEFDLQMEGAAVA